MQAPIPLASASFFGRLAALRAFGAVRVCRVRSADVRPRPLIQLPLPPRLSVQWCRSAVSVLDVLMWVATDSQIGDSHAATRGSAADKM
ncbi:hypothetical protein ASF54_08170 [Frondihabitans sp. Leaf304]|nr:hypothetical protein ASF54_08170 [Frondihabitans sp. Leaf304]